MVQHAGGIDEVELPPERTEPHDVGLGEFDIGEAQLLRHALGVAEAGEAQIDRDNPRLRRLQREFDGGEAGPATGKKHVGTLPRAGLVCRRGAPAGGADRTQRG